MGIVTSFIADQAGNKVLGKLKDSFKDNVIELWSRRKADIFFEDFFTEISKKSSTQKPESLDSIINTIIEDLSLIHI